MDGTGWTGNPAAACGIPDLQTQSMSHLICRRTVATRYGRAEKPEIDPKLGAVMHGMVQYPVAKDVVS